MKIYKKLKLTMFDVTECDLMSKKLDMNLSVPEDISLPMFFEKDYERILNLEVYNDDVFVVAFPKAGSRWTQEMVWLLLNNFDFETAREVSLEVRSPVLEIETVCDIIPFLDFKFDDVINVKRPRCIKTHLPWTLMPKAITTGTKQPKIIVCVRCPEDTCISYFHHLSVLKCQNDNWEDFCHNFLEGKVLFGSYWKHLLGLWNQRQRSNIMFLKYSEMKVNLAEKIKKVAAFLDKNVSDEDVARMCHHLTFENLKKSKGFNMEPLLNKLKADLNPFVRKGIVGDHKDAMSTEIIEAFKKQREEHLTGTGLILD